ncbi:MAG: hypothetical protein K8U03_11580 [Planctomycetia bacterium]|nr:hypothetical protein [Planctomycetia bacterium]
MTTNSLCLSHYPRARAAHGQRVVRATRCFIVALACSVAASASAEEVSFLRDIAPLVTSRCTGCHGDKKAEGDYRLHTFEFLTLSGASGTAAVKPGKPDESELLARLVDADPSTRMPQEDDPFTKAELDLVRRWIAAGAKFDGVDPSASIKSQLPARKHPAAPERYAHPSPAYALAWSPATGEVAVAGHYEVTLWSAEGKLVRRLGGLPLRIHALKFDRAGKRLLVGGGSPGDFGELSLVDPTGKAPPRVVAVFDDVVLGAAWNRDDTRIAAASADRSVRVFDAADLKQRWTSRLHSDFATAVSFRDDDRFVATAGKDCTVKVLDAATGKLFTTFNGHQMNLTNEAGRFAVADVAFLPKSPRAVSVGEGRSVRLWEPEKAQAESGDAGDMESRFATTAHTQFLPHASRRPGLHLAAASDRLFVATGDGPVKQFDLTTLKPGVDLLGSTAWTYCVDVEPVTLRVAAGSHDGTVRIWDAASGRLLSSFVASPGWTSPAAATPKP